MRDLLVLLVHFLTTLARLLGPGGTRAVIAETLPIKHRPVILNRSRRRAPNLTGVDRSGAAGNHSRIAIRVTIRRPGMLRSGLYIGWPSNSWRGRVSFYPGSGSVPRSIKLTLHAHISVPSEPIGDMAWHPCKTRAVRPHEHLFLYFPESSGAP